MLLVRVKLKTIFGSHLQKLNSFVIRKIEAQNNFQLPALISNKIFSCFRCIDIF